MIHDSATLKDYRRAMRSVAEPKMKLYGQKWKDYMLPTMLYDVYFDKQRYNQRMVGMSRRAATILFPANLVQSGAPLLGGLYILTRVLQ